MQMVNGSTKSLDKLAEEFQQSHPHLSQTRIRAQIKEMAAKAKVEGNPKVRLIDPSIPVLFIIDGVVYPVERLYDGCRLAG
jgi:hypothetical protein